MGSTSAKAMAAIIISISAQEGYARTDLPGDVVKAMSDINAYRTRIEAIAETAKSQNPPSSVEYSRARDLYTQTGRQNAAFAVALTELLSGDKSASTVPCSKAATKATLVGSEFIRQVGAGGNTFRDKSLLQLVPPFVNVLTTILRWAHDKKISQAFAATIRRELTWTPWDEL